MTAFYVGQLVKVSCRGSVLDAQETTVISLNAVGWSSRGDYLGCEVDLLINHGGGPSYSRNAVIRPEHLVPINNDKSLPAEIIAMQELPDCDVADLLRKHEREGVACES